MFIGRKEELHFLESRYKRKGGQLIVLYGRRRIGKTELLREFCKDKAHVFYACSESTDQEQLRSFSERMLRKAPEAAKYLSTYANWQAALAGIQDIQSNEKKLLIIDEFPYMVRGNKSIPSILQNLWDEQLRHENIMLILCGSSMSFIENNILSEKNPLYGRATGIYKMNEMDFYDAAQFFPDYSQVEKLLAYAVLGGVPHYLKQFDEQLSIQENIQENILTRGSILYNETEFLMRQELRETPVYNSILNAVAMGCTKLNEIHLKTQLDKSHISVYLRNLMDLRIVEREFPVADSVKQTANVQRGLYQIKDPFFRFWYRFVYPNRSELESDDIEGVYRTVIERQLSDFASKAFESVCITYLRKRNRSEELPFRFSTIGRWWKRDMEIDIMATDAEKQHYLLGECKWLSSAIGSAEIKKLEEKAEAIGIREANYYLFSKSGFTQALLDEAEQRDDLYLVALSDLFS